MRLSSTQLNLKLSSTQLSVKLSSTQLSVKLSSTQLNLKLSSTQLSVKLSSTQLSVKLSFTQLSVKLSSTQLDVKLSSLHPAECEVILHPAEFGGFICFVRTERTRWSDAFTSHGCEEDSEDKIYESWGESSPHHVGYHDVGELSLTSWQPTRRVTPRLVTYRILGVCPPVHRVSE